LGRSGLSKSAQLGQQFLLFLDNIRIFWIINILIKAALGKGVLDTLLLFQ